MRASIGALSEGRSAAQVAAAAGQTGRRRRRLPRASEARSGAQASPVGQGACGIEARRTTVRSLGCKGRTLSNFVCDPACVFADGASTQVAVECFWSGHVGPGSKHARGRGLGPGPAAPNAQARPRWPARSKLASTCMSSSLGWLAGCVLESTKGRFRVSFSVPWSSTREFKQ